MKGPDFPPGPDSLTTQHLPYISSTGHLQRPQGPCRSSDISGTCSAGVLEVGDPPGYRGCLCTCLQSGRHSLKLLGYDPGSSALPGVQAKADTSKPGVKGSLDIVGLAKCRISITMQFSARSPGQTLAQASSKAVPGSRAVPSCKHFYLGLVPTLCPGSCPPRAY